MKLEVQEIVLDASNASVRGGPSDGWPPEDLKRFAYWLEDRMGDIPEQYRSTARIVFTGEDNGGDTCARVIVSYRRPETDEEEKAREVKTVQTSRRLQQFSQSLKYEWAIEELVTKVVQGTNNEQKIKLLDLLKKELGE
jgi:hypothetical protein